MAEAPNPPFLQQTKFPHYDRISPNAWTVWFWLGSRYISHVHRPLREMPGVNPIKRFHTWIILKHENGAGRTSTVFVVFFSWGVITS